MSPIETFEHLVRRQSVQELVPFLLQLAKQDVVPVRLKTKQLYQELNEWRAGQPQLSRDREPLLFLAGLATYSRQEALGRTFTLPWDFQYDNAHHPDGHQALFRDVLHHSRPTWLLDWLLRTTRSNPWRVIDYGQLSELADAGLVDYDPWLVAQALANRLNRYNRHHDGHSKDFGVHILRQLQANPTLLHRDVPLLFDFDTPVDSVAVQRKRNQAPITWLTLLPQLVESGHLDRGQVLTRCLLALRRDFRRPLLTWFKTLFVTLRPTGAERLARQTELGELLAHPLPLVVNFALDQLKDLWEQPAFAPAPLLLAAEGLMTRQDLKTALRTLLATFDKLLKRQPALAPTLAQLATAALTNADAAVQERAAKLLAAILGATTPRLTAVEAADTTSTIGSYADLLSPAARTLLTPFLRFDADAAPTPPNPMGYAPHLGFVPDISPATAIVPVADWHELLFLTGPVLQQQQDPAAFERWLDGLLRLRGQFPEHYTEQLRPYLRQAFRWDLKDKTDAETTKLLLKHIADVDGNSPHEFVQALLISWVLGFARPQVARLRFGQPQYRLAADPVLPVEQQRLAAAEAQLRGPAPLLLLSTPSHAPHWVAPSVLVQKLLAYEAAGQAPDAADLVIALTRTAFRADADAAQARHDLPRLQDAGLRELLRWFLAPAASLEPIPTPVGTTNPAKRDVTGLHKLLASLLGKAPVAPRPLAQALPWLWAVAARTRYPDAVFDELRPLADYPGVAVPWQPGWYFEQKTNTYKQSWNKAAPEVTTVWQELCVPTAPKGQGPPSPLLLYSLHARLLQQNQNLLWSLQPTLPWLLSLFPNNAAPLHWHLLRTACRLASHESAERDTLQLFLRSLLPAGLPFDEPATVLLAVGLTHSAPVCRALALEALLAAIGSGRLVPDALGAALGKLLAVSFVPVQRLSDQLAQARAISPTTDDALRQVLDALLPALPAAPLRNTVKLLDAYADLLARTRQPAPEAVRDRLRTWQSVPSLKKTTSALLA